MTREEKSQVIEVLTTQLTEGNIIYLADIKLFFKYCGRIYF